MYNRTNLTGSEQSDLTSSSVDASVLSRTRIEVLASEAEVSLRTLAEDGSIRLLVADTIIAFLSVRVARNLVLALATLELDVTVADEPMAFPSSSSASSYFSYSSFSTDASAAM